MDNGENTASSGVTLTIWVKKYTSKVDINGDVTKCDCGSAESNDFRRGCMLLAAEKAGKRRQGSSEVWLKYFSSSPKRCERAETGKRREAPRPGDERDWGSRNGRRGAVAYGGAHFFVA